MQRVLVVDGYDESRELALRTLRAGGYEALGAEDEDAAADALAAPVDIVVLDLPAAEVVDAARTVRRARGGRAAALLALVDPSDASYREALRAAGVDYFILRPCPPAVLLEHLRRRGIASSRRQRR